MGQDRDNGQSSDTGITEAGYRMDKPETQASIETRHTENEQTRDPSSIIEARHRMDKPETHAVLRQET